MEIETSFGLAADAYGAFRPSYPAALFETVLGHVRGRARAVDLGAGTGIATGPLRAAFAEVIAVEPDPAMAARIAGVTVRVARAEDVTFEGVDLVTCANSFHWMNGPAVLARAATWLAPGGAIAIWRYPFPASSEPAIQAILEEARTGPWASHHHPRLLDPGYTRRVAAESSLPQLVAEHVPNAVELDARALVGFFASTSYGSSWLRTLADPEAALAALEERVRRACPGRFTVDFGLELTVLGRPG